MRSYLAALTVALLLPASSAAVHAAKTIGFPTSGQFDQVRTISVPRLSFRDVQSISFKGSSIRVDTADPSSYVPVTQIETPDAMYIYTPAAEEAEKIPITEKQPPLLERMNADTKSNLQGATKTGSGVFEGYNCDIYQTTANHGDEVVEIWVSKDPKFPFKLKTIATDKSLNKVTTIILQNISLNVPLDDNLFEIPDNVKIVSAPTNGQGQGEAQNGSGAKSQ